MTTPETKNQSLPRSPIIVVVGHVDHGKTSLIDYIRKTNLVSKEAGGITQSVGAYEIEHSGKRMTFIDTPGHEAFPKMRSRGAKIADLAVLVVAADDGVKPQTVEAIKILEETKTPFVVAITKIDKNNVDAEKAKQSLTSNGVLLEGFGGNVSYQALSSKTGEGVNDLLDLLSLSAEVENLTYDPHAPASGYILEVSKEQRRGTEAVLILKNGTLKRGDYISTASATGKIKILENFMKKAVNDLTPSSPAVVIGFEDIPQAGEEFQTDQKPLKVQTLTPQPLAALSIKPSSEEKLIPIILRAVDGGSLEALSAIVENLRKDKAFKILEASVGDIHDSDVKTAIASQGLVIGFKSKISGSAARLAETYKVEVLTSDIIYKLVEALEKMITTDTSAIEGQLEILAVFNQTKAPKQLVGGRVTAGTFREKSLFAVKRGNEIIGQGRVLNLQQNKEEASSVQDGKEAGLMITSPVLIQVGDLLLVSHES